MRTCVCGGGVGGCRNGGLKEHGRMDGEVQHIVRDTKTMLVRAKASRTTGGEEEEEEEGGGGV